MLGCSAQSDDADTEQGAASALKGRPEQIRLKGTGLCVDRAYGGVDPTTEILLYPCHGNANQRWSRRFGSIVFDTYVASFMTEIPTRCLTAITPSQPVSIQPCQALSTKWTYKDGTLNAGGKCLAVRSATSSARVVWNDCNGTALQKWEFLD
jgi:hypothetical protein